MTVALPSTRGLMDTSHPQSVLSKLSEQQAQGLFCDVTIVVEDVKFRAHRNVLAATSGYFRNALTSPEVRTSSQVLELMDLRSEVFANILNFLYNSSVTTMSTEETRLLVAAGRRLGIPYLERLTEANREGSGISSGDHEGSANAKNHRKLSHQKRSHPQPPTASSSVTRNPYASLQKKEAARPKERGCAATKGPRITNAFSITEVGAGDNPFTPLEPQHSGPRSPSRLPTVCPGPSSTSAESEPAQALSEHSYAVVSQGSVHKTSSQPPLTDAGQQAADKRIAKTVVTPPKTLTSRNFGPIKKRHRLNCIPQKLVSTPTVTSTAEAQYEDCPTQQKGAAASPGPLLSPLSLEVDVEDHAPSVEAPPLTEEFPSSEQEPPSLSPQEKAAETVEYRCEYCTETFGNRALLNIHTQVHKRRFVSHLFCKHCHRKFIHLKRLRNHEQMCPRALKGPPQLEPQSTLPDQTTNQTADMDSVMDDSSQTLPPLHLTDTFTLDPTLENPLAPRHLPLVESRMEKGVGGHRAYKCSVCKRTYVTLSSLKRHENVHSWHRAYPCHYCNKVFALAEYRTKHEIWHTGERRYQCIFCLETFMTYYILKNHQKAFHGIDPRLAVKKKAANGGFKGSVYPIKLYRLLPMKFRKKRYKSYSQTFSNTADDQSFPTSALNEPPTPDTQFGTGEGVCSGQSLLSMPVTFMATPKTVAVGMPHVSFERPCDQDMDVTSFSDVDMPSIPPMHADRQDGPSDTEDNSSIFGYTHLTEPGEGISMGENSTASLRGTGSNKNNHAPFVKPKQLMESSVNNRLADLSAAAHTIEAMASQLLLPNADNHKLDKSVGGKTETYIAKPACPGPSIDSQVLPLCHITVKIGNEAIIRRKIKGSKLFPRKRKRKCWSNREDVNESTPASDSVESPSLRLRTEVTASIVETETFDDPADPETDKLWRPYYSYKPKKKGKKLRAKHKTERALKYYTRPVSPEVSENSAEVDYGPREDASLESTDIRRTLRSNSPKTAHACTICKSLFSNEASLRMHALSCNQYDCRLCGKRASTEEILKLGIPQANGSHDFVCKSCTENGSYFDNSNHSPSTEKRYRCSYCPQRFLYLATKRSHEKKHQEKTAKGYSCQYCSKVCKTTAHLALHEKRHFIKTEESDNEDEEVDVVSHQPFAVSKEKTKVEPWDGLEICDAVAPKEEETTLSDCDSPFQNEGKRIGSKTTPVLSPRTENPFLVSLSELQKNTKHKRRYILDRPKSFGLDGNEQGLMDHSAQGLKGSRPSLGLNSHCSTGTGFSSFLTKDPIAKGSIHQVPKHSLSKPQCRLWTDEPYFLGHK